MFEFTIKPDGADEYQLTADSRDISMWERTTHKASVGQLVEDMKMSELEKIACFAARRAGRFDGEMDRFRAECAIEFHEDDEEDLLGDLLAEHEAGEIDAEMLVERLRELRGEQAEPSGVDPTHPAPSAGTSSPSPSQPASRRKSGAKKATGR